MSTLAPGDRVAVVATRRARPQPAGALADLGAALARHGARTVELTGLTQDDAQALVSSVSGNGADPARVAEWLTRTGGNPFFLVELARLATTTAGWRGDVPGSVQSVVTRRLEDLPDATREVLVVSAALGREHSPLLLAHVGGWGPDEVNDRLEPAHEVGIVHQRDDGRLVFEHALTRDAVVAAVSPGRLARVHARIAHALDSLPRGSLAPAERAFDLAHHWLAAGPVHAPQAWRAAAAAAAEARRDFANVEAADLYRAALDAHALDPAGTRDERYDLLLSFAEAAAWAAKWRPVVEAVAEAVALGSAEDDPERVARAAAALTRYSVWTPQEYGEVDEDVIDDLRSALRGLDHHDSPVRCVLMLALAVQLYYRHGSEPEVLALVDEGTAAARRIGDPALRSWAGPHRVDRPVAQRPPRPAPRARARGARRLARVGQRGRRGPRPHRPRRDGSGAGRPRDVGGGVGRRGRHRAPPPAHLRGVRAALRPAEPDPAGRRRGGGRRACRGHAHHA